MADDDLIFADSVEGALSKKPRKKGPAPKQEGQGSKRKSPPSDPMLVTRPVQPMGKKKRPAGPRRPPPEDVAMRPHVLVSPVLSEPLLLSRSKKHVVGREEGADIRVKTDRVSRKHAEIFWDGRCFVVQDLGSTNGSLLNGHPLLPDVPTPLKDDDVLSFGNYELTVTVLQPGEFPDEDFGGATRRMNRPL